MSINFFFEIEYNKILYYLVVVLRVKHKLEKNNCNNKF